MRRALVCLLAAAALLTGPTLLAAGQGTTHYGRALATIASSYGEPVAEIYNDAAGTTKRKTLTAYDEDGISIADGKASSEVGEDASAIASVTATNISMLAGRITIGSVTRVSTMDAAGHVRYSGSASDVVVDGKDFGDLEGQQEIKFDGGSIDFNHGNTGAHLVTTGTDQQDFVISVARTSQKEVAPTPTPTPSPTRTARPTRTPTPSPTPTPTPKPRQKNAEKQLVRAAKQRFKHGRWIFPVFGDARVADNYGAPREAPIVTHIGDDIFAAFGTPVVAVQDGTLSLVGTLPIAGNRLWLTTADGDAFFYAHLSAFAPVAKVGARVKAGEVLGYVGNTGDAEPTPPHLHFEVHPGGEPKPPINPYPIVTRWQDAAGGRHETTTDRPGALVTVKDFLAQ